ncbi:MAG: mechanosensitive ion channel family protein, partial [Desulfobacterales bacterium]|nr:mechanosensitive ion channel family protein [Desulfobacterales bacterium]
RVVFYTRGVKQRLQIPVRRVPRNSNNKPSIRCLNLSCPLNPDDTHDLITLFGLAFTGVIALSSATLASNAMAGLMLRAVRNFKRGDYIRVGDFLGRVTERGLFHTEIQTEDRDLSTLPNLYLITNPVTVVHSSGTIISASLSIGYDNPWSEVEDFLKQAAKEAQLEEPFVLVKELNDFSVSYKVSGFLTDVKHMLSAQSNLRKKILDTLHQNGIEIVSPTFMNQRRVPEGVKIIPTAKPAMEERELAINAKESPEGLIFDKAEEASEIEKHRSELARLLKKEEELKATAESSDDLMKEKIEKEITSNKNRMELLKNQIERMEAVVTEE